MEARVKLGEMLKEKGAPQDAGAMNDLGMADSHFHKKSYAEAYPLYEKFASENPESPAAAAALYRSGLSLYHMRYYSQAVETWNRLIEAAPEVPEAQAAAFQAADTLFRGAKFAEASAAYRIIAARYPSHEQIPLTLLRRAQAEFQLNNNSGTLLLVQELAAEHPESMEAIDALDLAEAVFDRDASLDFKEFFKTAATGEAQFRLGRRLFDLKDYAGAAQELQRFSVLHAEHPSLAKAQLLLGESYFNAGKFEEAASAYRRYASNYPGEADVPLALLRLGSAHYSLKNFDEAARAYETLASAHADSEYAKAARFNLALSLRAAGALEKAEASFEKYAAELKSSEELLGVLWEIFGVQKERKDFAAAVSTLEKIQAKAPTGGEAVLEAGYFMGEMFFLAGDTEKAREAWKTAAAMKPASNPYRLQALIKLAGLYERESDWMRVMTVYEDLAKNGNTPELVRAAKARLEDIRSSSATASSGTSIQGADHAE